MAVQPNDIHSNFQAVFGRDATPYELQRFSNAKIQDLASLKDIYAKQDQNSIVGYQAFRGQDFSMPALQDLAKQYGITNFGTPEGNDALLKAVKAGAPGATPVGGSITTPQDPNADGGSVSQAAQTLGDNTGGGTSQGTGQPPPMQGLDEARQVYSDKQSQVAEIDSALRTSQQDIQDSVSRVGGHISASDLKAMVYEKNKPLLEQRAQLVSEQAQAGKMYTDLLARQKESDNNFYKTQSADLAANKQQTQESQFAQKQTLDQQKLEQSGYKPQKVNITDSAGNVIGQSIQTWVNPANKNFGVTDDGINVMLSTNGGETTATPIGNNSFPTVDSKTDVPNKGDVTIANGFTPTQVYQALISGPNKAVKGIAGGVDQNTLYNSAIDLMMGIASTQGARIPAAAAFSVQQKKTEIMNAYGLNEGDVNIAKTQLKNLSATNASLLQRSSLINIAANSAVDNLDLAIKASAGVPRGGAKIINNYQQWLTRNYTPAGPLAGLEAAIYTYGREYEKVVTGSAASIAGLSDSSQAEVSKLLNAAQSPEAFKAVTDIMKQDMQNVISENNKAVDSFPSVVTTLFGFATGGTTMGNKETSPTEQTNVTNANGETQNVGNWAMNADGTQNMEDVKGVQTALNNIGKLNSPQDITSYIQKTAPKSPITADMITSASAKYGIPWENLLARFTQDSSLGTKGTGAKTSGVGAFNPGNVGNTGTNTNTYSSWKDGVDAAAKLMASKYPVKKAADSGGNSQPKTGDVKPYQGKNYKFDGTQWVQQ